MKKITAVFWLCLLVLVGSIKGALLGLFIGVEFGGNSSSAFSLWNFVGYELFGVMGALIGVGVGCFVGLALAKLIFKKFSLVYGGIGTLIGVLLNFVIYSYNSSGFLVIVVLLLPVIATVVGALMNEN